ncbi:SHC-transforming protein 4 [Bombina bombina]|uniref:SHC-transforming protein 4 n=1 Tax=Bombina bombina TaxID=8345 RepID=UPI00235AF554|nr:SHC-transforming protein 4 [Bombina bombina]
MKERKQHAGHMLQETFFRNPVMLQRSKYSRFKDDSLNSTDESVSMNAKGCANSHVSSPTCLPNENIKLVTQNSSKTLCTLIPKMSNFKLSKPANLLGLKHFSLGTKQVPKIKLTERLPTAASPTSAEVHFNSYLSASHLRQDVDANKPPQPYSVLFETEKESQTQHVIQSNMGKGLSYCVKYMGCIEVLQSMRSLDFATRTQVTREAISRLCEAVPGAKGATKKRKPPLKFLSCVLGKSNLQFSGLNVKLTISTNSLTLTNMETQQVVANHHMQSISFASGGDPDTTDYVAYVAKDPVNQRACHILECSNNTAQEVISSIGQAFEQRFKQYLKSPSCLIDSHESLALNPAKASLKTEDQEVHEYYNEMLRNEPPAGSLLDKKMRIETVENLSVTDGQHSLMDNSKSVNIYENCPENHNIVGQTAQKLLKMPNGRGELFDDPRYINTVPKTDYLDRNETSENSSLKTKIQEPNQQLQESKNCLWNSMQREEWYHGKMSRKAAESLLVNDGDFLVRESSTSASQYVLSGQHRGIPKHLLLVDPEGKVRTKDDTFEDVSHLIKYHVENKVPIISSGSELYLKQPVKRQDSPVLRE